MSSLRRHTMSPGKTIRAVEMYTAGAGIRAIADLLRRSESGVRRALIKAGVQLREPHGGRREPAYQGRHHMGDNSKPSTNSGVQQSKQRQQSPPGGPRDHKYDDKHNPDFDDKGLNSDGK